MFYNRNDDGITHGIVGFVVRGGKEEALWCSHESGGFAGGDESGPPFSAIMEEQKLATAATLGGTEATGKIVKTQFKNLLAIAGAAVTGKDRTMGARKSVEQFLVFGGDESKQRSGTLSIENWRIPLD